jgi:hypothetical protein
MPGEGLEPTRIAPPDPKSGASANSAIRAWSHSWETAPRSSRRLKPAFLFINGLQLEKPFRESRTTILAGKVRAGLVPPFELDGAGQSFMTCGSQHAKDRDIYLIDDCFGGLFL